MVVFDVTPEVADRLYGILIPHLKALNEEITEAYPEHPDMALAVALGGAIGTLLSSFSDPTNRVVMADGMNIMARTAGYALTPVT